MGGVGRLHQDQHSGIDGEAGELCGQEAESRVEMPQGGVNSEVLVQDLLFDLGDRRVVILGSGVHLRRGGEVLARNGHGQWFEGVESLVGRFVVRVVEATEGGGER